MAATIIRELECKLTQKEWRERARRLAQSPVERAGLETEAKRVASEYKTKIGKLEEEERRLASAVREGVEYRDVACHEEKRLEQNAMVLLRDDTGEVVEERPMDYSDRQAELDLDPEDDGDEPEADGTWQGEAEDEEPE